MHFLFGFSGRTGRAGWWLGQLVIGGLWALTFVVYSALVVLFDFSSEAGPAELSNGGLSLLIALLISFPLSVWINMATTVRRFHDRGKSGWWFCLSFIPFGVIWLCIECGFLAGSVDHNQYGPPANGADFDIDAHIARMKAEQAGLRPQRVQAPVLRPALLPSGAARPGFGRRGL